MCATKSGDTRTAAGHDATTTTKKTTNCGRFRSKKKKKNKNKKKEEENYGAWQNFKRRATSYAVHLKKMFVATLTTTWTETNLLTRKNSSASEESAFTANEISLES
jgi:hypothetical protein